jgi:hypothetical protein
MTRMSTWSPTREGGLALGQRDPDHADAVPAGRVPRERAPPAADVEHALARSQLQLVGRQRELGPLRVLERDLS